MSMTNDHMLYGYRGRQHGTTRPDDSGGSSLLGSEAARADERRAKRALLGEMTRVAGGAVVTFLGRRLASWFGRSPAPLPAHG